MNKFEDKKKLKVGVWNKNDIDTDIIIPSDFLKVTDKKGLGEYLFDSFRFIDEGKLGKKSKDRILNKDFFLNQEKYKESQVLITGKNFGCGSSREHAPWALVDYGFKVIIAPSFANIFYENAFKNGLLLITLDKSDIDFLIEYYRNSDIGDNYIFIDLENQKIIVGEREFVFDIDSQKKKSLLLGLDEVGFILKEYSSDIKKFETEQRNKYPFLYKN